MYRLSAILFYLVACTSAAAQGPDSGVVYRIGDQPPLRPASSVPVQLANFEAAPAWPQNRESSVLDSNQAPMDAVGQISRTGNAYQVPRLASVEDPISLTPLSATAQDDPSQLLSTQSNTQFMLGEGVSYAQVSGTPSYISTATWAAPNLAYRPLLFEDANLERYGNQTRFQNVTSAVRFFSAIPTTPYRIGCTWNQCEYARKHDRPGNCVPAYHERAEFNARGAAVQALVTTAIIIP